MFHQSKVARCCCCCNCKAPRLTLCALIALLLVSQAHATDDGLVTETDSILHSTSTSNIKGDETVGPAWTELTVEQLAAATAADTPVDVHDSASFAATVVGRQTANNASDVQSGQHFTTFSVAQLTDLVKGGVSQSSTMTSNSTATTTTKLKSESVTTTSTASSSCRLVALDPYIYQKVRDLIVIDKVNLLEYKLVFPNSTSNPLLANLTTSYRLDTWARVSSSHGQTLLSLAFNYGVLSLTTLTLGTERMTIDVADSPDDCTWALSEAEKIDVVLALLMRDFKLDQSGAVTFVGEERVCHEVIDVATGRAKFEDRCYYISRMTGKLESTTDIRNPWLTFLYVMLMSVRLITVFFGPLLLVKSIGNMSPLRIPYVVKLKEPLAKTIYLHQETVDGDQRPLPDKMEPKCCVDLRSARGFTKLKESLDSAPRERVFTATIEQYHIDVAYKRLMVENRVPVGFWYVISRAIFQCKLKNVGPFVACCKMNMLRSIRGTSRLRWLWFWKKVGLALLVLFVPTPYYVRLFIFYAYEYEEVLSRKAAAQRLDVKDSFNGSLMHYLTPTHPLFVFTYIVYFVAAIIVAYMARHSEEGRLRKVISGSFNDLRKLPWVTGVLNMVVLNIVWPFQRYGVLGLFVAVVYWPLVVPLTFVVAAFYSLPTLYLTVRMVFYSRQAFLARIKTRPGKRGYRVKHHIDDSIRMFYVGSIFSCAEKEEGARAARGKDPSAVRGHVITHNSPLPSSVDPVALNSVESRSQDVDEDEMNDEVERMRQRAISETKMKNEGCGRSGSRSTIVEKQPIRARRVFEHLSAAGMCLLALYSCLILLSECLGCFVEIAVFTLMGVIVNAGTLLKYVSLGILVVVYSYDSFNNVEKKYLKLNKALFGEVKGRIKNLEQVTSQPANLQENCAFKSQEQSEQASYEVPDDLISNQRHWLINDLVLFVDNEDMPRIPRQLFDDVCQIRVAGVPGPVYRGLLTGLAQFLKIVVFIFFVFVVVLSFGEVYRVSSTNQMLATLAGGFLPVILRQFMEPERPDIEIGTVKFKTKLDEVIKNFHQFWPLYDLAFKVAAPTVDGDGAGGSSQVASAVVGLDRGDGGVGTAGLDGSVETSGQEVGTGFVNQQQNQTTNQTVRSDVVDFRMADATTALLSSDRQKPSCFASNVDENANSCRKTSSVDRDRRSSQKSRLSYPVSPDMVEMKPLRVVRQSTGVEAADDSASKKSVYFDVEEPPEKVDWLIIVPEKFDDQWLDEWSDIVEYREVADVEQLPEVEQKLIVL